MTNQRRANTVVILLGGSLLILSGAALKWQSLKRDHRVQVEVSRLGGTYTLESAAILRDTGAFPSFLSRAIGNPIAEVDLSVTAWPREGTLVPPVTDSDLSVIAPLTGLQRLSLRGMPVTDAAIDKLAGLDSLTHLDIRDTQISEEGLQKLEAALPSCEVLAKEPGQ